MDLNLKQKLRDKLEIMAPLYGLTDICFPSFTISNGLNDCLSASDVMYSISTILETSPKTAETLGVSPYWDDLGNVWQTVSENPASDCGYPNGERSTWWVRNFFEAHDVLSQMSPDGIMHGIQLCMKTQKEIALQCGSIINQKQMKVWSQFQYTQLDTGANLSLFDHPSSLTKLTLFLTNARRVKTIIYYIVCSYLQVL
jgi:cell division control protein 45